MLTSFGIVLEVIVHGVRVAREVSFLNFVDDFPCVARFHVELWCWGVDDLEDDVAQLHIWVFVAQCDNAREYFLEHLLLGLAHAHESVVAAEDAGDDSRGSFF